MNRIDVKGHIQGAQVAHRLELLNISKNYNSLRANNQICLKVKPGQIHAILGENGAGKSTLMKIIYGAVKADEGQILWNGKEVLIDSPATARKLGIGMVYQHFSVFETLTVVENIALGLDEKISFNVLSKKIKDVSVQYGLEIDPQREVHTLSIGERQRVEIIRCLLQTPSLIILDEPTSVLTPQAVKQLFVTLKKLAKEGVSILYISHKLHEITELCDEATIIRNGSVTGNVDPRRHTANDLAKLMIGRELPVYEKLPYTGMQQPVCEIKQLSFTPVDPFGVSLKHLNLEVFAGEIVGIAGISGNGQSELLSLLSGESTSNSGNIFINNVDVTASSPDKRRIIGFGFVPEERLGRGSVPNMSLAQNSLLTAFRKGLTKLGLIQFKKCEEFAEKCISEFNVKASGPHAEARSLSGGNLQKFIVGREILQSPKFLVVAQPTWGVDIGAAMFLRQTLIDLSRKGVGILVISEELEELFEISDRICVIANGEISDAVPSVDTNAEKIGLLMSGIKSKSLKHSNVLETPKSA